jgi:D-sedoheptulose 7-phosphate isomerase
MTDGSSASVLRKVRETAETQARFFEEQAPALAACAERMASAFDAGARLFTFGNGGSACDAEHLALEFLHPVIEKRPALPAIALTASQPLLTAIGNDQDFALVFAQQLRTLARAGDIAIGISTSGKAANVVRGLAAARELGLLTVGVTGRDGGKLREVCEHCFTVPSFSIHRIQEAHGTLIHLLWDLVHMARGAEDVVG